MEKKRTKVKRIILGKDGDYLAVNDDDH